MDRRMVREDEVDTKAEIAAMFQQSFDNQYLLNARIEQLESKSKSKSKKKDDKGSVTMKTLISLVLVVLMAAVCFASVNINEINHDTVTGTRFAQDLRGWIDTLNTDIANAGGSILSNRGTGDIYYVDSSVGNDSYVGTRPEWALATIDAATGKCTANNGDVVFIIQGHATTIDNGSSDAIDLDVAGVTYIGLGYGTDAPELTYDTTTDEMVFDADNVVIYNIRFLAGVSEVANAIDVKDGADNCAIIRCIFPEPTTSSWEFDKGIIVTTADNLLVAYCEQKTVDEAGATNFIDNDGGVTTGMRVVGNVCIGEYAEGIYHSDDADLENYIAYNDFSNVTSGQHALELTAAATGTLKNNTLSGDTYGAILDPGSMRCFGNQQSLGIDRGPIDVPLISGKTYSISTAVDEVTADLFDVDGGSILILNMTGVVDVAIGSNATNAKLIVDRDDGSADTEFTTAVAITSDVVGTVYVFSNANAAVLTPLTPGANGSTTLMSSWYCPEGMVEQAMSADPGGASGDHITWSMTFIPLEDGITVVPQG